MHRSNMACRRRRASAAVLLAVATFACGDRLEQQWIELYEAKAARATAIAVAYERNLAQMEAARAEWIKRLQVYDQSNWLGGAGECGPEPHNGWFGETMPPPPDPELMRARQEHHLCRMLLGMERSAERGAQRWHRAAADANSTRETIPQMLVELPGLMTETMLLEERRGFERQAAAVDEDVTQPLWAGYTERHERYFGEPPD